MEYKKIKPDPELLQFIECYYLWQGLLDTEKVTQSPPNSYCAMVFNFGDLYKAYQGEATPVVVPRHFISGQFTSNYHLVLSGSIDMIGIVFKPSALFNFFDFQMPAFVNSRVDLQLVAPEAVLLAEQLEKKRQPDEIKKMIDNFFRQLLPRAKKKLSFIEVAIDWIDEKNGICTVDDLSEKLNVSRRYLEKKFSEKTGISPKFYTRLKRFSVLSNLVVHQGKPNWQQILYDAGFHDQSHFIKEYFEFNRTTPSEYFENHQELIRFLDRNSEST